VLKTAANKALFSGTFALLAKRRNGDSTGSQGFGNGMA
jgi:hypothetical protein